MDFDIVSEITEIETIAIGVGVRDRKRLWKMYGKGRWRKRKGVAQVRLVNGKIRLAEIHWYEAHGIGKKECKLKLPFLD
jgi:nucleotidyltransferase/DNA polymerase involved in DNA repair